MRRNARPPSGVAGHADLLAALWGEDSTQQSHLLLGSGPIDHLFAL